MIPQGVPTPLSPQVSARVALRSLVVELRRLLPMAEAALAELDGAPNLVLVPDAREIVERRTALKCSQNALAHAANISRSNLSEIERGRRSNPQTLIHIGRTLSRLEDRWTRPNYG